MDDAGTRSAVEWLVSVAADPRSCRREWERNPLGVTLLPAGVRWDVHIVGGTLGRLTLEVLARLVDRPGPVLTDLGGTKTGFFVPPGTTTARPGAGTRGAGAGSWIVVPYPGRVTGGVRWLVPPDGTGALTDPRMLRLALREAAAARAADGL